MSIKLIRQYRTRIVAVTILPLLLFLLEVPSIAMPAYQVKPVVRNVHVEFDKDVVIVTFDLVAKFGETYEITAALVKEDDPNFSILLKSATGDIGKGEFAGSNRRIDWDFKKDVPKDFAGGPEYSVEVSARWIEKGGGGSWVYYVLGGAVVAGGAFALVGLKKGGGEPTSAQALPAVPPGRPF